MVNSGEIIRVGRNRYCLPNGKQNVYSHKYSELAKEVAVYVGEMFPYLTFSIFELIQMNDFVFDSLKEKYPGKVLINPTVDITETYLWQNRH